ncbi:MAG: hypothetical protein HQL80_11365, partial [Magnetococcales bacterium]|nr:hypothetical protein [Magnetococcales bacterium]
MTEQYRNALPIGHRLHEYRIEKILGAGGFGVTQCGRATTKKGGYKDAFRGKWLELRQ